ncbi:sulfite exporter TauE/SafE family protein [Nodosilinea sp. PGN35]|uniref:urease accessory protein UreH domain-containing protein n=1 Tax=Nodosilinea sp. PGN35 TaxID=3020489 RepID=UPI0023B24588|nr:sulfite exporter TauE/SafE family protein [Nodosilinea sp. TSF1-S3]MDF0369875.1 sulfite exporter TauE/SafE family protein [Nodosilinea sp. TSF1-S3]
MLDLLLIASVGFLGSFGHCLGMCGPLTVAFSLSQSAAMPSRWQHVSFHLLLNLGRLISYALVGLGIGALGSVLVASGQMAGIGSPLRQGVAVVTGLLLIWFGLAQISPQHTPKVPFLNPMAGLHDRLSRAMQTLSLNPQRWTPLLLGLAWGLIPCGFLYAAQLKAAETTDPWAGGATMLAFGLGTLPMMLGVGVSTGWVSSDRRGQLFRLGGWITLIIGLLTVFRGSGSVDLTGHGALVCLVLALIARPVSHLWAPLLIYRRALGVGAFVLSVAHLGHMVTMGWNPLALPFLLPRLQVGGWAGIVAFGLMTPLALTSFDQAQRYLGVQWRRLHLLSLPVFVLVVVHALLLGSHYLGGFEHSTQNRLAAIALGTLALLALLLRWRWFWSLLSLEKYYVSAKH